MIEHLATAGTLNAPRKHRFSEQFNDDILNMVASLTDDVTKNYKKVNHGSGILVASFGVFEARKYLSFCDFEQYIPISANQRIRNNHFESHCLRFGQF